MTEKSEQKPKHVCCTQEYEHNLQTESVYCTRLDQWLAMKYCTAICGYFKKKVVP